MPWKVWFPADRGTTVERAKESENGVFTNQMCIFATHKTKFAMSTQYSTFNAILLFVTSFYQLEYVFVRELGRE